MSEPLTKRLSNNISYKKYSIKPQTTANLKTNQNKYSNMKKNKNKPKSIIKKENIKIKVKRNTNKVINSRNNINSSEISNSLFSYDNHNKIIQNENMHFVLNNNDNNENKFNREGQINNEKYTKDSDFYPKTFYINNYNNNYINISNITIENNNDKSQNQEKENDNNSKNEEVKKSFSDKSLLGKKSLNEDIIICDEKTIDKNKDEMKEKSLEFYSGDKKSNLSCLLSSTKNDEGCYDSFYSKSKKHIFNDKHDSINNAGLKKKEKGKKRIINISLNYRNRSEVNNIYSNKKFYHHQNNKTFFRESKSVKNFILDLKTNKAPKEKHIKMNNSATFRKIKKLKTKEKDSTFHAESIKKIFKTKNTNKYTENKKNNISKNLSLKKNCIINKTYEKNVRDLSHSMTKKNYNNNAKGKNMNNISKNDSKNKINDNIENRSKEKKFSKLTKNKDKINNMNKFAKEKKNSLNTNFNKKAIKSKENSNIKNKYNKINTHTKQFSSLLSYPNTSHSKKTKIKDYPNMFKKAINTMSIGKYSKKIKNIKFICKVGDSGSFQKKLNQDNYFITNNFLGNSDYNFIGVCDGHGVYGQNISSYLKEHLPMNAQEALIDNNILDLSNIDITTFSEIIESIYKTTNSQMNSDERIDSSLSGSTCIAGLYTPSRFLCINVGDSRCVLFKYFKSNNYWTFSNLSRDHKPSDKNEKNRILNSGGKVEPYVDEKGNHVGPERVWATGIGDRIGVPGLAMSRSFGDQIAHSVGVVVSPEILEHNFCDEDKIILLASDGIWEFIDNEEALNIVKKYYEENNAEGALEELYHEADKKWRENEGIVDDITAIILFLE